MNKKQIVLPVVLVLLVIIPGSVMGSVVSSLTIKVYKGDGSPLSNAVVELYSNGTLVARGVTDANGSVVFSNVSTGEYIIYVYYNGSVYVDRIQVTANTSIIELSIDSATADSNTTLGGWDWFNKNKLMAVSGLAVLLFVVLLIAYAFSGRKIPRRR